MNDSLRTIAYFLIWGTFYGFMLGAWSGTAIFPAFGTVYATLWGTGIGAACGLLCGLLVALIQAYAFHPDVDLGRFRRRLTLGIGIFVPIVAPILLIATSQGTLWDQGIVRHTAYGAGVLPFCLVAAAAWGSLSSAYVTNAYPEWLAQLKTGQRSTILSWPSFSSPVPRLMIIFFRRGLNWGSIALGVIVGIYTRLPRSLGYPPYPPPSAGQLLLQIVEGCVLGFVASAILVLLISFGNAALLNFLRKTIFAEDVLSVSPRKLRWTLVIIAFVFTGITSAWTLILAPLCALLMALYVYDAFPLFDEDVDKAKRKEKNTLALEDNIEAEGSRLLMDESTAPRETARLAID